MQREYILMVGEHPKWYHKLRGELRATPYRLLRARHERVASWLMERVKVALVLAVPDAAEEDALGETGVDCEAAAGLESMPISARTAAKSGVWRPTLVIRREDRARLAACGTMLAAPGLDEPDTPDPQGVLALAARKGIPLLRIMASHSPRLERTLGAAIQQGADYILLAPYEQSELIQAIRTAMLNGPSPRREEPTPPRLDVSLRDRLCALEAGPAQLARLLVGAMEQVLQARARASWCESEIRALRQARVQSDLAGQSPAQGLPEVVQGVAHDFANLLEAAGAAATALYGQPHSPQVYRDAMRAVMEQSQELIGALTELTGPGRENWRTEPVDLDSLVTRALMSALLPLRDPQIRVRVRMGGLEPVWAHRSLVYRALLNLIWNAVQAMPHGGMLSILGYVRGNRVVIEVGDTGVGISRQDRQRVLREQFSTKSGHRGMGLTMVRELIEKCGGEITFTSRPNHGSLFSIALPVASRAGLATVASPAGAGAATEPAFHSLDQPAAVTRATGKSQARRPLPPAARKPPTPPLVLPH